MECIVMIAEPRSDSIAVWDAKTIIRQRECK